MNTSADNSEMIKRRLFVVGLVVPLTAAGIGVDGGPIFQMLAAETLELDSRAVGTALLLGALSVPVQIWAARIPLHRARHNARLFLWLAGSMAFITSGVVLLAEPGTLIAGTVLAIAVLAEIAVSVLYVTAWQPLISYTLSAKQRQFLLGKGRATTGVALLLAALVFGELDRTGRAAFLAVLGVCAITAAWSLRVLPPPPRSDGHAENDAGSGADGTEPGGKVSPASAGRVGDDGSVINVYVALASVAFASWPLLIFYASVVMWQDGNLGYLAAALSLGSITASTMWRDPEHRLITVLRAAAVLLAGCSAAIVALPNPIGSTVSVVALLAVTALGAASRTVLLTGITELTHRRVTTSNTVRVMTMMDVVGSTSFQVGAFVAGFLISSSIDSTAALNLYQIWILAAAAILVVAIARIRPTPTVVTD